MSSNMVREFQVSEVLSEGWEGFKANTGVLIATMWFVVDRNMSVVDSIKASFEATRGSLFNLFIFGVIAMALSIVGSIPCGLGLLVVVPVLSLAASHIYMALTAEA